MNTPPTLEELRKAHERIRPYIHRTPVLTCTALNEICGADLYFKCENFQKVGAFKIRGACNSVFSLSDPEAERGVATHSSGNHAAALALAARRRGIRAYVVMPENAPPVKRAAVEGYGAVVTLCRPTLEARESSLKEIVEATGAEMIHPYNDYRVIAGQGTAALELIEEVPGLDMVMTPVGGGGLLSGTATAVSAISPGTEIIAAEPEMADGAFRSLKEGRILPSENPDTIADGLRTSLGTLTFPIIQRLVKDIVTVSEEDIIKAMALVWERMKIVIEPSAAVPVGALLKKDRLFEDKRIGVILSGGNVDAPIYKPE